MIPARATRFRFTLWRAAAPLAVIAALLAISQSALAAPQRPAGLTTTALDHDTVSLTWSDTDAEDVDHYQVLRRSSDETRLSQIATTQTTSYQDDGLQPETEYTYRVRAVDSEGARSRRSVRSQTTTAAAPTITPVDPIPEPTPEQAQAQQDKSDEQGQAAVARSSHLPAPTNLRVTGRTIDSITFAWNAITDSTVTHTYITYSYAGTDSRSWESGVLTSFTIGNVPQNTAVSFNVGWAPGSGNAPGTLASIGHSTLVDKQAQNLTAAGKTSESVRLTWENPAGYNVTGYEVQRRTGNSGSFTTLEDVDRQGTGFEDTTVAASTTYTYRVIIRYKPSGALLPSDGNAVDLNVTTPAHSTVGRPINFRITNATLTSGVYVLANHDDSPILDWEYTQTFISYPHPLGSTIALQGYDETGYKFTRKWIDSDATCGTNCPWLVVALAKGTGHTYFTDTNIAPGTYTFRIRALDENNNPGAAAEITVRLPDAPAFVPTAPTSVSLTAGRYGSAVTVKGSWDQVWLAPAYIVQWKSGAQDYQTTVTGNRSLINAWSGPHMLGADGNDQWSPAWHKFYSRQNSQFASTKDLGFTWDTTYTVRVGRCLTTACSLDDVVFASERTVTTPMEP